MAHASAGGGASEAAASAARPIITLPSKTGSLKYRSAIVNVSKMRDDSKHPESPAKVVKELVHFLQEKQHWNLERPKIILHITGTANPPPPRKSKDDFEEDVRKQREGGKYHPLADFQKLVPGWFFLRMKQFISSIIFDLAFVQNGPAWMFDGGTDCGIMKLVGNLHKQVFASMFSHPQHAVEGLPWHSTFPLIGVSQLSNINVNEFQEYSDDVVASLKGQKESNYFADKDHTHHLFMQMNGLKCSERKPHDCSVLARLFSELATDFEQCPIVRSFFDICFALSVTRMFSRFTSSSVAASTRFSMLSMRCLTGWGTQFISSFNCLLLFVTFQWCSFLLSPSVSLNVPKSKNI